MHQWTFRCNDKTIRVKTSDLRGKTKKRLEIKYVEVCKIIFWCILSRSNVKLPKHFSILGEFFGIFNPLNYRKRFNRAKICHICHNILICFRFSPNIFATSGRFCILWQPTLSFVAKLFLLTWIMTAKSEAIEF